MAPAQPEDGYRYSLDPFLLVDFAALPADGRIADLGTGVGIIPLLLAERGAGEAGIVGIERQPRLAALARANVTERGLARRIEIVHGDLRDVKRHFAAQQFDAVFANPPFRVAGSGRLAPHDERAAARHELHGSLLDFVEVGRYLLKNGGRLFMVHLPERLAELLALLREKRLEPKRLTMVHHRVDAPGRLVLVEGRRAARPGLTVTPPLLVADWEARRGEGARPV